MTEPSTSSPPEQAARPVRSQDAPAPQGQHATPEGEQAYECPFCVLMRKGGCEPEFKAFMECGEKVEKEGDQYAACLDFFEALQDCMARNKTVYDELLKEMQDVAESAKEEDVASGEQRRRQQQQEQQQKAGG